MSLYYIAYGLPTGLHYEPDAILNQLLLEYMPQKFLFWQRIERARYLLSSWVGRMNLCAKQRTKAASKLKPLSCSDSLRYNIRRKGTAQSRVICYQCAIPLKIYHT